jgi:signal transduction histidine kinase
LQDAQQQLVFQEKMSAVATLTAGVSHEISASVDRAHASAQALEREIEDFRNVLMAAGGDASPEIAAIFEQRIASMQTQLGTMIVGTSRVRDIATDLRTFSRLDASKPVHATLADSLLATVQLVQSHIQGSTRIECYLSANPMVECWPEQLNQVFMNLIINACHAVDTKYADTSRRALGLVKISSEVVNEQLAICVEDNGSGIDPKVINRIFDPFYTTKQIGEGSGLGLSISFGIVEKHHGQIKVASVPGEGSKFTVMIPLRQPVTAE